VKTAQHVPVEGSKWGDIYRQGAGTLASQNLMKDGKGRSLRFSRAGGSDEQHILPGEDGGDGLFLRLGRLRDGLFGEALSDAFIKPPKCVHTFAFSFRHIKPWAKINGPGDKRMKSLHPDVCGSVQKTAG
jgi:hypothetical protein